MRSLLFVAAVAALAGTCRAAEAEKPSVWVKLCDAAICIVHYEHLDTMSGGLIMAADIRQVAGTSDLLLSFGKSVPVPKFFEGAFYSRAQWGRAEKSQSIPAPEPRKLKLMRKGCNSNACFGEYPASPELLDQMKAGGGMIFTLDAAAGKPGVFRVPLEGFEEAFTGPPTAEAVYKEARRKRFEKARKVQAR